MKYLQPCFSSSADLQSPLLPLSLLHLAARHSNTPVVQLLCSQGADTNNISRWDVSRKEWEILVIIRVLAIFILILEEHFLFRSRVPKSVGLCSHTFGNVGVNVMSELRMLCYVYIRWIFSALALPFNFTFNLRRTGRSPLDEALQHGAPSTCKVLISFGAKPYYYSSKLMRLGVLFRNSFYRYASQLPT